MTSPFTATHVAPDGGVDAWTTPDPSAPRAAHIEARVEMRLLTSNGAWANIECSNGWRAWVDGRLLVPVGAAAPAPASASTTQDSAINPAITTIGSYTITLFDLVPAVGLVLSALMPWLRGPLGNNSGFKVPITFLVDTTPQPNAIKIGLVVVVAAALAAIVPARAVRCFTYAVALAVLIVYVIQLHRLVHHAGVGLGSVLGSGVYVGLAAAALGIVRTLTVRSPAR